MPATLAHFDDVILNIRLRTVYQHLTHRRLDAARKVLQRTLSDLQRTAIEFRKTTSVSVGRILKDLHQCIGDLYHHKHVDAHNRIRDLHYALVN